MANLEHHLHLRATRLEVARGYDGILGRDPDPAIVTALYACRAAETVLLARSLQCFSVKKPFPGQFEPGGGEPIARHVRGDLDALVVLFVGLELDGREDLQRVYGAAERANELAFWQEEGTPHPQSIADFAALGGPGVYRVNMMLGASHFHDAKSDKWVGAALCVLPKASVDSEHRVHFVSQDGRNDWTLVLHLDLRVREAAE